MAFSDEMIRAVAKTGQYSDPKAEQLLADVLIQRRDKIGRAYLNGVSPLVNLSLDDARHADVRECGGQQRRRIGTGGRIRDRVGAIRQQHGDRRRRSARRPQRR